MNKNQPNHPGELRELAAINARVTTNIRAHQRKIRVLAGAAILLGFLAVAASVLIVSARNSRMMR